MREFIILMAYLTALVALSIDAMLPALGVMGSELKIQHGNNIQLVIGFIFLGMTIGQLIYGPLADAIGRKATLFYGLALFVVGCIMSWLATDLSMMLIGRFIQGLGVSAPRIVTVAIIRDKYHGRDMAYIFSMVMGVFILVPAIAPAIGQVIIHTAGWRSIFLFYIICTFAAALWAALRLEETLKPEARRPFDITVIANGFREAATTPVTLGYAITSGLAFSALIGYLSCAQQIFHEVFKVGDMFALYFGMLALAIGSAFFTNSAFVRRYGMRSITRTALIVQICCAMVFTCYIFFVTPGILAFMIFAAITFFCLGLTFGNMNAMAMEPMGHMAGLASAFIGSSSSAISVLIGSGMGQLYDGTITPMVHGFLALGFCAFVSMLVTEHFRTP